MEEITTWGSSMVKAFAEGYREQRLKTPHILICDGNTGDWEGEGPICAEVCYCWCHL